MGACHAFVRLLRQATARVPMRVLAFCLMPNHFQLCVWPIGDDHLARWMAWLLTTQVRR
jgi:putative transposase